MKKRPLGRPLVVRYTGRPLFNMGSVSKSGDLEIDDRKFVGNQ